MFNFLEQKLDNGQTNQLFLGLGFSKSSLLNMNDNNQPDTSKVGDSDDENSTCKKSSAKADNGHLESNIVHSHGILLDCAAKND
jgi:hypothetical protein